jgi:polar amino acid transport system substrate-binding protein
MTEENPPFNFEADGRIQGIAVDLLLQFSAATHFPVKPGDVEMFPWPRAYRALLKTPGTSLFSMARTEQREKLFKWVGPIYELTIGLTAKKDKHFKILSIQDLAELRVGSVLEGAPEQLLIKAGFDANKLQRVAKPEYNIKKLAADRIDALAFNTASTRYTMKSMGLNPEEYETVFVLKRAQLYYAFNRETDAAFIKAMNRALEAIKTPDSTGKSIYGKIVSSYLDL